MKGLSMIRLSACASVAALACLAASATAKDEFPAKGGEEVFKLAGDQAAKGYSVQQIASSAPANVLWPGEKLTLTLQVVNLTDQAIQADGKAEIIQYGMTSDPVDVWTQAFHKLADCGSVPVRVAVPAKGFVDLAVEPKVPDQFGAYVLVLDLGGQGRQFAAAFLRVPKAAEGMVQYPTYALDLQSHSEEMCSLFERLGIKGTRIEMGYANTAAKGFPEQLARWTEMFARFGKHNITTMVTLGGGGSGEYMPLGRIRSLLNDKAEGPMQYPGDFAWLPKYDEDFQKMVATLAGTFGWPKGPVNAVELWNEPWEGSSISGWGADLPRYREIYEKMALGVEDARAQAKVDVLIGGACSSMNTEDKLFCDGTDTFLKWLDFTSIHYQPMGNVPVLIPQWMERKSPHGPVRAWDTESWVANSEERVAAVIASMRAQGLARTAGVLHDKVRREVTADVRTAEGAAKKRVTVMQAWSPGAGIAATQAMIGQRAFRELMFKNGLPWVFVFDGLPGKDGAADAEDGTVVVVGDLGGVYERELCKFRSVYGLANVAKVAAAKKALARQAR